MQIVEFTINEGKISNKDVQKMFSLSNRAVLDEISKLIKLEVLKQECNGRSTHYILT
jgi:predicted HTH transcriptional regulator